jgi:hypothetical protein
MPVMQYLYYNPGEFDNYISEQYYYAGDLRKNLKTKEPEYGNVNILNQIINIC